MAGKGRCREGGPTAWRVFAGAAGAEMQPAEETLEVILVHKRPGTRLDLLEGTHARTLMLYPRPRQFRG
jgi:hypothetical protein